MAASFDWQASRLEFAAAETGAIAQLGERLLCKQEVVGSIPSGSTSGSQSGFEWFVRKQLYSRAADAAREFSDIVKRRSLRAAGETNSLVRRAISSIKAQRSLCGRKVVRGIERRDACRPVLDRRGRRADLEASWSF